MSIQKSGASLISQTAEANFGLATLNVDFSVIKLQAPAEYKPLGCELIPSRRSAAEDGMPHVTARKLGALFQDWIPPVPDLIKAYGRRAVEIAQCRSNVVFRGSDIPVEDIDKMLPNSMIALGVTSEPQFKIPSIPKGDIPVFGFSAFSLDIGRTFACIALFESGSLAVSPDNLSNVLAIATGDSIFIAAALLCDPAEGALPSEVRRVWGSIGKPGIAMMIPPKEPQIRDVERDWRVVSHNTFDGKLEDSFQSTTLHLRFTDYVLPIHVGSHGNRDFEVYFLESVVSIHDHGDWVADLDILGQLNNPLLRILGKSCLHTDSVTTNHAVI
ncbi:hypothetical protein BFJ72_g11078 [Fusarium proliferatum]|uniref:Uncharacterized protein n=1 Tax=Gibberella intermedia TaxID=948311 RepID=A0A420SQF6_GIBIN|nr:hypothetical protein BFJ72_g11078 [Fusarium proliferatum]